MLERFMQLEKPLKIYYSQKEEECPLSAEEFETIRKIIPTMKLVEESTMRLSAESPTLFDAELIIEVNLYSDFFIQN